MTTPEQRADRLGRRLRALVATWRRDAADLSATGGRMATLNMCARQVELLLEELGLKDIEIKGTALRPARGDLYGRACSFAADYSTLCDARGPVWDLVLYDRALVEGEPNNAIELGRRPCCFAHGAAEQRRRRDDLETGEDR